MAMSTRVFHVKHSNQSLCYLVSRHEMFHVKHETREQFFSEVLEMLVRVRV